MPRELTDHAVRRIHHLTELVAMLAESCRQIVDNEQRELNDTLKQRLPVETRESLMRRALALVEIERTLRGENLEESISELTHLLEEFDEKLARQKHATLYWSVLALRVGFGKMHVTELPRAAYATIIGQLPNETGLENERAKFVEELEAIENAARSPGNFRQLQLDGDGPDFTPPPFEWDKSAEAFFDEYIRTALEDGEASYNDDRGHRGDDKISFERERLEADALRDMRADCQKFLALARPLLESGRPHDWPSQGGYDFWMTRNGHGVGFWETPEDWPEEEGAALTAIVQEHFGSAYLDRDDEDGRIYYS